jgi:CRP-like cAMP-binding protein
MENDASRLRVIALFEDLADAELAAIARASVIRAYARGSEIAGEQDKAGDVFFILSGAVRASSVSPDGREIIYSDLAAGDIVGEFAAIDGGPRASGMVAASDCILARMPAAKFAGLLEADSALALRLIQLLVAKIRRMSQRVFEVSALSLRERVRRELLRLAAEGTFEARRPGDTRGRAIVIQPAPTHYEFAARIGSHREAVTRELNRLEEAGVLQLGRREIRIVDFAALEQEPGAE